MSMNVTSFSGKHSGHPRNAQATDLCVFYPTCSSLFKLGRVTSRQGHTHFLFEVLGDPGAFRKCFHLFRLADS